MKFHNIEQNSEEWYKLRAGRVTSSKMAKIMANFGKEFGEPAKQLAHEIALERFTGTLMSNDGFKSSAMQRGNDLEPVARDFYEREEFQTVTNGGFIESDDGKQGTSLDGKIGEKGAVEIKCPLYAAHWKTLQKQAVPSQYVYQVHHQIMTANLDWEDFVSYCPEFPEGKQLFVLRVERDEEIILKMKIRLAQFEELVEENIEFLTK